MSAHFYDSVLSISNTVMGISQILKLKLKLKLTLKIEPRIHKFALINAQIGAQNNQNRRYCESYTTQNI